MMNHCRLASLHLVAFAIVLIASGCSDLLGGINCTTEMLPTLAVEVRDPVTGAPAARGVTGTSEHESGLVTELTALDDLHLGGNWSRELPGRHTIQLRRPGFVSEVVRTTVGSNTCHVEPVTVQSQITPDVRAVLEDPVSFTEGPPINAYPASAGVELYGDTLEIKGFAPTDCKHLRVVAFRLGIGLHVQVEPSGLALEECLSPRRFEVRYILPPERTILLVTNGLAFPVELFDGQVQPN